MSSAIDVIKCQQCGGCYSTELDCRTLEDYGICLRCGKRYEYRLVRDEQENPILDKDGKPQYVEEDIFGYASLKLAGKQGVSSIYSFDKPLTDEDIENIKKSLDNEEVDAENSYLTKWDEEKKDVVSVFGVVPQLYDEVFAVQLEPCPFEEEQPKKEGE